MKLLIVLTIVLIYMLLGIFLEKNIGIKSCPFFALYGAMFGMVLAVIGYEL